MTDLSEETNGARRLADALYASKAAVIFTGAGMSTECGIPDFRTPGGIWDRMRPIEFDSFVASEDVRREAWRRKFALDREFAGARPGRAHAAVARLVDSGRVSCVITQNIDNMHQLAGISPDRIIELHGNGSYAACLDCGARVELETVRRAFEATGSARRCDGCGGLVKTATVSFGQAMPEAEMARAEQAALGCDLFIVLGSSLVVYPAAGFPLLAKQNGAHLIIVNREPTPLDDFANLVMHAEIGDVLAPLATSGPD